MKKLHDERSRKKSISICLDSDTREKLEKMARDERRSVSSFVSMMIEKEVESRC